VYKVIKFRAPKIRGISWLAEQQLASLEEFYFKVSSAKRQTRENIFFSFIEVI
jgi:hypothetical protein